MTERKPILCLDFDGVIHDYKEGWKNGEIYGNATPGFFAWALKAVDVFQLVVYSSRSKDPDGGRQMREAIGKWSIDAIQSGEVPGSTDWSRLFGVLQFASEKPPAFLTIDDRALTFVGSWGDFDPASLLGFKTWTEGAAETNRKSAASFPIFNGDHAEFEREWADKDPKTRPDWPLPSFDAKDWAEAFCRLNTIVIPGIDEVANDQAGIMVGWFANALMRGYDEGRRKNDDYLKGVLDMHEALGVKWGDDVYAEIKRLKGMGGLKDQMEREIEYYRSRFINILTALGASSDDDSVAEIKRLREVDKADQDRIVF